MAKLQGGTTVYGLLSTSGVIYASGGNSDQWNNTYTTVSSTSSSWNNKLALSGGTLTGGLTGTTSTFTISISAPAISGVHYGDGSKLTGIVATGGTSNDPNKLPLSGGTISGNLLINGGLTALSGATFINTVFQDTSALRIYNSGLGPALYVEQAVGSGDIAKFYDADGIEVLHVGNALNPESSGVIGIKTSTPNKTLTINGEVSAASGVWASTYYGDGSHLTNVIAAGGVATDSTKLPLTGGTISGDLTITGTFSTTNTDNWQSTYTTVCANSTQWAVTIDNTKLPLSGGTLTGSITGITAQFSGAVYGSTAVLGTSSTQLANTAFVYDSLSSGQATASTVIALVTNADSVPLVRGNVVYSYGSQGDRVSVRLASASAESTSSKTLGFVNDTIAVGQTGYVTLYGSMDKLDLGSPFVAGDALYLGTTPGTYTRTKPQAPIHMVYLGTVQRANGGNGTAYIKVQNGYELNEIHDVQIITPLSGQILQRNDDNTLWINKTPLFDDSQIVNSGKWNNTTTTVSSNSGKWESVYSNVSSTSANWNTVYNTVCGISARWESVYNTVNSNSSSYVTLTATQKLENKTVVDWMTLVRGYNTTPTLNTSIPTGDVYTYVYNSSPSNITYYRFIATDGSTDAFYTYFSGTTLSGLVASKSITI